MELIDEENDILGLLQLVHHGLHPFLELASIFRAGHQGGEIEGDHPLAVEDPRNFLLDDPERQAFGNGGLPHAGLPDQHRVVLFAAAQHLCHPLDFLLAAHDGIQLVFDG